MGMPWGTDQEPLGDKQGPKSSIVGRGGWMTAKQGCTGWARVKLALEIPMGKVQEGRPRAALDEDFSVGLSVTCSAGRGHMGAALGRDSEWKLCLSQVAGERSGPPPCSWVARLGHNCSQNSCAAHLLLARSVTRSHPSIRNLRVHMLSCSDLAQLAQLAQIAGSRPYTQPCPQERVLAGSRRAGAESEGSWRGCVMGTCEEAANWDPQKTWGGRGGASVFPPHSCGLGALGRVGPVLSYLQMR